MTMNSQLTQAGTKVNALSAEGAPLTMSSREIAELAGKLHKNVLRDIRDMLDSLKIDRLSFERVYRDAKGEDRTEYRLPKDLTLTLISGYSVPLRHAIVTRWQELEAKEPAIPAALVEMFSRDNGMLRMLSHKVTQIEKMMPAMIEQAVGSAGAGYLVREGKTAGQVIAPLISSKDLPGKIKRGVTVKAAHSLRKFCERNHVVPRECHLGNSARAYVYPVDIADRWVREEGRSLVFDYICEKADKQPRLTLVS